MIRIATALPTSHDRIDQWGYVLPAFDLDACIVWGTSGAMARPFHKSTNVMLLNELVGPLVLVHPLSGTLVQGETDLVGFAHPADCTYIFGPDDRTLTPEDLAGVALVGSVYVPTRADTNLFSATACAIVLYDRIAKNG